MCIRQIADRLYSDFNAFTRNESTNHQDNKPARRKPELLRPAFTRTKTIAIHAIGYELAPPPVSVSFIEIRICAHETVTSEKTGLGTIGVGRPVAILSHKYMRRARSSRCWPTKCPIGKRVAAGYRYVVVGRTIMTQKARNKGQFLVGTLVSE